MLSFGGTEFGIMNQVFERILPSSIPKHVTKNVTLVGHLKGSVLELPENKSVTLKNFTGDNLTDKVVEVRGTLTDTQTVRCESFSDFGKDFGKHQ